MYYIWHGNSYPTYQAQLQAEENYHYMKTMPKNMINADANSTIGTIKKDSSWPKSKPSDIKRGTNWRSYAPHNSIDEWKWMPAEHKWVRFKTFAIRNAYIKWKMADYKYHLAETAYQNGDSDIPPKPYAMNRDKKKYQETSANVNRNNQEANAWFHENYNGGSFYTIDTQHAPNMQQYLSKLSDDQLNDGINYWNRQLKTPHTSKEQIGHTQKTIHYNTGDAVMLHHEQNYRDPANLVNQAVNGGEGSHSFSAKTHLTNGMIFQDGFMTNQQGDQINKYAKRWNAQLSNQQHIKAEMNESTTRGNYRWLKGQYGMAQKQTKAVENQWNNYMKTIPYKDSRRVFHQLMTSGKRQLEGIYYLDHTYYDRDMWRLNAYKRFMPIRHQQEINASIQAQIQNNRNNNLSSIWRADRKTDQVIGFVENTPNESVDMNLATEPIDSGMPQTNYAQTNQLQLTDTGDLYDRPLVFNPDNDDSEGQRHPISRWNAYNVLRNWEQQSIPLDISGFNHWNNILIQSISKQPEQTGTDNALQITLTIQKVRLTRILWGKKPKSAPQKGRANRRANNRAKGKMYRVRPGDNVYTIAHGNMKLAHSIINANPAVKRHPNLIYPKQKLVIPNG